MATTNPTAAEQGLVTLRLKHAQLTLETDSLRIEGELSLGPEMQRCLCECGIDVFAMVF